MKKTTQFRKLLAGDTVVMPGAFNALTALLIEQAGFSAYYLSGAGLANGVFGRPDIGLTTRDEAVKHAVNINSAVGLPGIADADTGFGEGQGIAQTVRAFERSGIAGIHIEDQHEDKRCGHLDGKQLISVEEMESKLSMAVKAKSDPDFLIIARTDARAVEGRDAALQRAQRYVAAGAEAIFPEACTSEEDFRAFRKALDVPLLANMTEFGKTPYFTVHEFRRLGYNMVMFPMTLFRVMAKAAEEALREVKATGTQKALLKRMQTRDELYRLLKYQP